MRKPKEIRIDMTTVNISIPVEVLKRFDEVAKKQYWNRSNFFRLVAEYYLQTHYLDNPKPRKENNGKK